MARATTAGIASAVCVLATAPGASAVSGNMTDAYFAADSGQTCRVTGWLSGDLAAGTTVQSPFTANLWRYFAAAYCPTKSTTTSLSLRGRLLRNNGLVSSPSDTSWEFLYNGPAGSAPVSKVVSVNNLAYPNRNTGSFQACADVYRWATVIQTTCTPALK